MVETLINNGKIDMYPKLYSVIQCRLMEQKTILFLKFVKEKE